MRSAITALIAALIVGSELSAQNSDDSDRFCEVGLSTRRFTSKRIDREHPRYFVEVVEVPSNGKSRTILTALRDSRDTSARIICERVNTSVDRHSKIVIRPNRDFLDDVRFEGNFSISGRIETGKSSRAIEIPGYSVIGKETQVAPVGVAASSTMEATLAEVERLWPQLDTKLDVFQGRINAAVAEERARSKRLAEREQQLGQLRARYDTLLAKHDDLERRRASADADVKAQLTSELSPVETALQSLRAELEAMQREQVADSVEQRLKVRPEFVGRGLAALRENRSILLVLSEFTKPENLTLVRATARAQQRLPGVLVSLATRADSLWRALLAVKLPDPAPESVLRTYDEQIEELRVVMRSIANVQEHARRDPAAIRHVLLGAVKDAEFNVSGIGAEAGNVIVLTLTDSTGVPPSNRSTEIRLTVRDFGLVPRVSDAVLFTNTWREHGEADRIAAARGLAQASGSPSSFELPVPTRGSPTAGVSFGWIYSPRRDDVHTSRFVRAVRVISSWLEPGFGFNATAASVPMRRLTIAPDKPTVEEAAGNHLAYALGGGLSIFNGALVWSGGWTLNGSRARPYTGLGISFLSATDKARELFKGLNP